MNECKDAVTDSVMTEMDLLHAANQHLADACCALFETTSPEGHALAFMVDAALKYGQVVMRGDNVLLAAADYSAYEEKRCGDDTIKEVSQ